MAHEEPPRGLKPAWAYAYQIVPPQPEDRLRAVKALLDHEGAHAKVQQRTWAGRFVVEQQVTHILVVSDSPDQDLDVNQRLETALRGAEVGFALTAPPGAREVGPRFAPSPAPAPAPEGVNARFSTSRPCRRPAWPSACPSPASPPPPPRS
jgi:hypothetical protein